MVPDGSSVVTLGGAATVAGARLVGTSVVTSGTVVARDIGVTLSGGSGVVGTGVSGIGVSGIGVSGIGVGGIGVNGLGVSMGIGVGGTGVPGSGVKYPSGTSVGSAVGTSVGITSPGRGVTTTGAGTPMARSDIITANEVTPNIFGVLCPLSCLSHSTPFSASKRSAIEEPEHQTVTLSFSQKMETFVFAGEGYCQAWKGKGSRAIITKLLAKATGEAA